MPYTPEQAKRVLATQDTGAYREFWEALANDELPQYFCQRFAFKKLYSDDLPPNILVGLWHPDYPFMKCTAHAIIGINHDLQSCMDQNMIRDPDLQQSIEIFVRSPWNSSVPDAKRGEYWTTPEEIDRINAMLDAVINYLETTYSVKTDWGKARTALEHERTRYRNMRGRR